MYNICAAITCQDLDDPAYGRVDVTGNGIGHKAHYKCDYGYQLVGEAYRECLHTGYWGGKEPVCERK
jgi:CUB/sushi domain-containing protein